MKNFRPILLVIALLITPLLMVSCTESKESRAEKQMLQIMEENSAVGLSVAVVKDDKIIYSSSFGFKDLESQTTLLDGEIFRIASISKSFTATALLALIDKGVIGLDDDVSDIVGFNLRNPKYADTPITIKMLLSHTSSLSDKEGYFNLDVINPVVNKDYGKCYNDYMPGSQYEYCNLGFNTLGAIVEKYSEERFDQYIRHAIINPLQLNGSFNPDSLDRSLFVTLYEPVPVPQPAAYASRSQQIEEGYQFGYSTPLFSPTGGMKISAIDLAKYMMMHINYGAAPGGERIISEESSRLMQSNVVETGEGEFYGLALRRSKNLIPGEEMVGHTGSAYGLYSAMFFQPQKKFGIVLMTNGCNPVYSEGFVNIQKDVIRSLYNIFIK